MSSWVDRFRTEAENILKLGWVREIDFSGSTYQVEVRDPQLGESWWPFLQFDENGKLQDAFCTCASEAGKCVHLAAARLKILGAENEPLHFRFERSFWNQLCSLFGDHSGYEERFLQKEGKGRYLYHNEVSFEITAKTQAAEERLKRLLENRLRETPENSIKFSNVTHDEIVKWREGRPGPALRYALSFWPDLAKWMMEEAERCILTFEEDPEGFPTLITTDFPSFSAHFEVKKRDLPQLIPSLATVKSPLKVFELAEEKVEKITFDPTTLTLRLEHSAQSPSDLAEKGRPLKGWAYLPGVGFYSKDAPSLLSRSSIAKEEIPSFLRQYQRQIAQFIPIHEKRVSLSYSLYFDKEWNWHFAAWLFEKGDLLLPGSALVGNWVFLKGKGFFPIEEPLFEEPEAVIPRIQVSRFVNHHRIWLNGQEGFQTHLASIESHLVYTVTESHSLCFYAKAYTESTGMMDFGEWIYYAGQGFFSKEHARLGLVVRPGLEVPAWEISHFIRTNREDLEIIPNFFTTVCPLESRGLEIKVHSSVTIQVKPVYKLRPEYVDSQVHLFGDFAYSVKEGFCELPPMMRLPDDYVEPVTFSYAGLHHFFEKELPQLMKYCPAIDPALIAPHKLDVALHYLVRTEGGGLKAQLFYHTEYGQAAVTDLLEAAGHKRRYCFSEAGLIDLQSEAFQWLKTLKNPYSVETQTLEISTLDLIRLDATFGLLGPSENTPVAQMTRNLLAEFREFTSHDTPSLKGLTSSLRLYQQTGLQWLWFLYKNGLSGLLCDDMGLGKTHQAMALIAASLNQKGAKGRCFLVVCPTSVIYHWEDKLERFLPHIKVHTFHGVKRSLKRVPKKGLILTSYGILRMERKKLEKIPFEVAIFDEVQVAKNPHSRVHEALKSVQAQMKIGLTGTPIENNLRELKALFDIVLPGYMPSEARYRELFITPIERDGNEEKKAVLGQMIRPFVLRRKKTEVLQELPEKSEDKSYCELSEDQVQLYTQILSQMRSSLISDLSDQGAPVNYVHIFALLSHLKQVCDHPALIHKDPKNYKDYSSGKWDLFVELLEEARESQQKVVVFSQFLYMLDIVENYLQERGWGYAQIRGDTINRREELRRFQEDPNCVVFIGSLHAAGLGIDLTAASVVIMYDRWWNAAKENQAIDRVHRIGQKWGVQVYKLITKNTIEEKIDRMITRKGRLLEEVIGSDDQDVLKKFTREELIELLTFSAESSNTPRSNDKTR